MKKPLPTIKNVTSKTWSAAKATVNSLKKSGITATAKLVASKLGSKGTAILTALKDGSADYNVLVSKYGWENVTGVLEVLGVASNLDQTA